MNPNPRQRRRLLALVPLALGVGGASLATTSPTASASTGIEFCFEVNGQEECFFVPHAINWKDLVCPGCPPDFSLYDDLVIQPELARQIAGEVAEGVGDLLVAELIGDRAATTTGLDHLERAAALASGHLTSGDPSPHPWAEAVQRHVATGLDLLQQSAATRDPRTASGLHDQAVETLDKAIETLAEQTTVG